MVKLPRSQSTVNSQQSTVKPMRMKPPTINDLSSGPTPPQPIQSPVEPVLPLVNPPASGPTGTGLGAKERELLEKQEQIQLEEVRKELELAPEVKEAGVEVKSEEIELPPPLPKMGVTQVGPELPIQTPAVNLPLTDDKIVSSQGFSIWASITWLAQWCLKQLKKAHVALKKVHGRIVRTITK